MSTAHNMSQNTNTLRHLQKCLQIQYEYYKSGEITERQYLDRIRPIDMAIDKMELASLHQYSFSVEYE